MGTIIFSFFWKINFTFFSKRYIFFFILKKKIGSCTFLLTGNWKKTINKIHTNSEMASSRRNLLSSQTKVQISIHCVHVLKEYLIFNLQNRGRRVIESEGNIVLKINFNYYYYDMWHFNLLRLDYILYIYHIEKEIFII